MNLPNKLTVLRVVLIPFFLLFFFWTSLPLHFIWALLIFGGAALTDTLDGHLARKHNLITNFGKLMDPLADKLLVMSALVSLLSGGLYQIGFSTTTNHVICVVSLITVLAREFIVTSIRLLAAERGTIISADKWGKLKTVLQMVWICTMLLRLAVPLGALPGAVNLVWTLLLNVLFALMLITTVGSGVNYIRKSKDLFTQ